MLKAVCDTNVLVSALLSKQGTPNSILRQAGKTFELYISREILTETNRILHEPRIQARGQLSEEEIQEFLEALQSVAVEVKNPPILKVIEADPDDDRVLACAVKAKTDYLVSGDSHLKDLKAYKDIKIISPSEFSAILNP